MNSFFAEFVRLPDDNALDYGEGELVFQWSDPIYGSESLSIDLEGYCSRAMPIRSGQGPPSIIELHRFRIKLSFAPSLARQLELDEKVEISFALSDAEFLQLQRAVAYLQCIQRERMS